MQWVWCVVQRLEVVQQHYTRKECTRVTHTTGMVHSAARLQYMYGMCVVRLQYMHGVGRFRTDPAGVARRTPLTPRIQWWVVLLGVMQQERVQWFHLRKSRPCKHRQNFVKFQRLYICKSRITSRSCVDMIICCDCVYSEMMK